MDETGQALFGGGRIGPRRTPVLRLSWPNAAQRVSLGITTTPEYGCIAGDRPQRRRFLYELPQHPVYGTATLKLTDTLPYDKCDAYRSVLFPIVFRVAGRPGFRENQPVVPLLWNNNQSCASYGYGQTEQRFNRNGF